MSTAIRWLVVLAAVIAWLVVVPLLEVVRAAYGSAHLPARGHRRRMALPGRLSGEYSQP